MYPNRLQIDTRVGLNAGIIPVKSPTSHTRCRSPLPALPKGSFSTNNRPRNNSDTPTVSSSSVVHPTANYNSTVQAPDMQKTASVGKIVSRSPSPTNPSFDDTVHLGPDYVLAMHDFSPQNQNATCLSFRAGQVIHVLNKDKSGWWDGELEGRRGWFPSNYVTSEVGSLTEEELPRSRTKKSGHSHSTSVISTASWAGRVEDEPQQSVKPSSVRQDIDSYCPDIMVPLLHGLSLLQSAVRANRTSHFAPSTACIISCVRAILSATDTLVRDAPILQQSPPLSQERRQILSVLATLVSQAKRASENIPDETLRASEIENMLRLGGQVFAHVRRFLGVAVQCGVQLPSSRRSDSATASTDSENRSWSNQDVSFETPSLSRSDLHQGLTPTQHRYREYGISEATTSDGIPEHHVQIPIGQHKPSASSVSSISSSSTASSHGPSLVSRLPSGPTPSPKVIETLRATHDQYLSTIAAFIGHVHSHSRTSHASSAGHLYDLVTEVVGMVCILRTIVEAVQLHPKLPEHRRGNLRSAKEGLFGATSSLAESVRSLTLPLPPSLAEDDEKEALLRSATKALKAGAECVAAVKICLSRPAGEKPFIVTLPSNGENTEPFSPSKFARLQFLKSVHGSNDGKGDDHSTQPAAHLARDPKEDSDCSSISKSSSPQSDETGITSPDDAKPAGLVLCNSPVELDFPSPSSFTRTDEDGSTWEDSVRSHGKSFEVEMFKGKPAGVPPEPVSEFMQDPVTWMQIHDYSLDDVAYNGDGQLVGATMQVLVEKMTPHDSIVDPAFSAVFFLSFRLFSSPAELVDTLIERYNLVPPPGLSREDVQLWQQRKGVPVRLRVSNFIKIWVETYWRPVVDDPALPTLSTFTRDGLGVLFPGPAQRILELITLRRQSTDSTISPKGDRTRDPGISVNPPSAILLTSEVPRPTLTKLVLTTLKKKDYTSIQVTDFDPLELARQLTIMECNLYCAIRPEEILESGGQCVKPAVNVRAVSSLSTVITGWVAECVLDEADLKKRILLMKFFIKVADRCVSLHNYSTSRSVLAALDSSTISRLRQTWTGLPQKHKSQLEVLRRLADHSRNYHEYRTKLRNTAPPAVPFLGLYLTDVTFCREGNPSHRTSPINPSKKLINFNKYHKLARIVQDMQRFQVPYNLKAIPEVQEYLNDAFEKCRHHGDFEDLYRRSLLVEPRQPADATPASDVRQLFNWAMRSQSQTNTATPP